MMANFKKFIQEHKLILANAVLLALLMVAPLIAFPIMTKDTYQGINIANHGFDELWYLSRAKEALDGNAMGNALIREGKNKPDPYYNYVEKAVFAPFRVLGIAEHVNVATVYAVLNAVGVFLLALLIYFFVWQISGSKILAVANSLLIIGGYAIATPSLLLSINVYSRAMTPYIPLVFTFLYLNFLVKVLRQKSWKHAGCGGAALGILFYIYFYAWSYIFVLNASLILFCLIKKEYSYIKYILAMSGIGFLLGAYNIFNIILSHQGELGRQLSYFHWVVYSHAPVFNAVGFICLLLLGITWTKFKKDRNFFLFSSFILAGWLVLNQHVITGTMLQFGHYYQHFVIPTSIIVVTYLIWMILKKTRHQKLLFAAIVLFVYANTILGQYRAVLTNYQAKQDRQQYVPIIDYLNKEDGSGVVLAADDADEYVVTIYTPHDLFWSRSFLIVNVPLEERLRDTLYVYLYLNAESRNNFEPYLRAILAPAEYRQYISPFYRGIYEALEGYSSGLTYDEYYEKAALKDELILKQREVLIKSLAAGYNSLMKSGHGIAGFMEKYGITYVIWDKDKNPEWDVSALNAAEVASSNKIFLYKVN